MARSAHDDDTRPARGARVGDYVIDRPLAQGGFSVVYRATHADRGDPVALKVLHADLAAHPDAVVRFEREVEAIQRLEHPNVVAILDRGRLDSGCPHYVMELLDGVDLDEHLCARGRLPAEEALAILEPLCSALEAVHRCGIVHRDIKASNVFLSERDGRRRVVLLDFGVAKLLDAPGPALTASRHVVGTLACISPEQILGRSVDPRTDVYALGVLTYRMLVGQQPFVERSYAMMRQLHLHVSPPRPSTRARVSPAFDDLILRAMRKDSAERHPTVAAYLEELRAAAGSIRGAGAPRPGACARRAMAIYAEVHADSGALVEPDDRLLADLEVVLPFIAAELTAAGLSAVTETGGSVLFTADCPAEAAGEKEARRRAMEIALAIQRQLDARAGRDLRVHVRLCLHAGELVCADGRDGAPVGGELLELAAWVPDEAEDGVFASPEALADLEVAATPSQGALLRIDAPPATNVTEHA